MILGDLKLILIIFFSEFNRPGRPYRECRELDSARTGVSEVEGKYDFDVPFPSDDVSADGGNDY
jgi:hypothetical protein